MRTPGRELDRVQQMGSNRGWHGDSRTGSGEPGETPTPDFPRAHSQKASKMQVQTQPDVTQVLLFLLGGISRSRTKPSAP